LQFEELQRVILLGYSFGGLVITAVAERVPERLKRLVYLNAFVPEEGQSFADILGPEAMAEVKATTEMYGEGWRVLHDPPDAPRRVDQSIKPFLQPVTAKNSAAADISRTFIYSRGNRRSGHCTNSLL
jgi:pimeloyl-ACP methyl ester carboxylesterase